MHLILTMILALLPPSPTCGEWPQDRSSKEVRLESKARIKHVAQELGMSRTAQKVLMTMVSRESSGDPCAVHTLAHNEYGLGPLGLSVRWTLGHWDRNANKEVLMVPEVAAVVAIRIYRRAVLRHGAKTWTEVNSVFATGKIKRRPEKDRKWCARLAKRGVDCNENPTGQLGEQLGIGKTLDQESKLFAIAGRRGE